MNESQEAVLVSRCKAGDKEAFRSLLELHHGVLFGTAYLIIGDRETVRDVLQDAFVKIWGHFPSLQKNTSAKAWLVRIVANEAKQQLRRKRLPVASLEEVEATRPELAEAEDSLVRADQWDSLRKSLNKLPPEQRQAVILRYFSELTVPEVAAAMHEREGTIKSRLSRALSQLREILDRDEARPGR